MCIREAPGFAMLPRIPCSGHEHAGAFVAICPVARQAAMDHLLTDKPKPSYP